MIGIIGYGVVGKAVEYGFRDKAEIYVYDPAYKRCESVAVVIQNSKVVFIAVPTPMTGVYDGKFNSKIIDSVMADINKACNDLEKYPVLVIESAVLPSKIKEYIEKYPKLRITVSPEYLTEREPFERFINPDCRIIGGNIDDAMEVQDAFEKYSICKPCKVGYCDAIAAAVMKYMENSFLAIKVSFMNQFYDLLQKSGSTTEWEHFATIFHYDSRMGNSHYHIPGPDNDRGWGGKCLPKDINAVCHYAQDLGVPLTLMEESWKYNLKIRKDIDWATIPGAVVGKKDE